MEQLLLLQLLRNPMAERPQNRKAGDLLSFHLVSTVCRDDELIPLDIQSCFCYVFMFLMLQALVVTGMWLEVEKTNPT